MTTETTMALVSLSVLEQDGPRGAGFRAELQRGHGPIRVLTTRNHATPVAFGRVDADRVMIRAAGCDLWPAVSLESARAIWAAAKRAGLDCRFTDHTQAAA